MGLSNGMGKIISLCKRRGFIFQSSEEYGGGPSTYDYGPLGVELKNNIKELWWKEMVRLRDNIVGLDSAILMHPRVWEASGHVQSFSDELVECKRCHKRFRADHIGARCPECKGELTKPKRFNLMFKTTVGATEETGREIYLRPETAQGIYVDFKKVYETSRLKVPFGIAQIGKAFRNEITPGDFIFRTREFEQMEMQFFVRSREAPKWFDFWKKERMRWYNNLGINTKHVRFREHQKDELAHYAKRAIDIEYKFFGEWKEIEGIHNRGDWDLSRHSKYSGKDLSYYDDETHKSFIPYIVETSGGVDRSLLAFLVDAYTEVRGGRTTTTKSAKDTEIVLKLHKNLAPIKVAVLPLVKKQPLITMAQDIYKELRQRWSCQYDEVGSIGRRYRRQDETGAPFCVTIDFNSLEDKQVTSRDRDTMKQERVPIVELIDYLKEKIE
ncbi:glycine--tRNA ligase [Patescibacteria group bacterium AH-259-L07]|nr:glycine--tRNA ligase [Patescibacteria group bacterium AH-259-L07]